MQTLHTHITLLAHTDFVDASDITSQSVPGLHRQLCLSKGGVSMSTEKDRLENASDEAAVNPNSSSNDEEILSDDQLDAMVGGLNPQPLPPGRRLGPLSNEGWER